MKAVLAIIGVIIIIVLFGTMLAGIHSAKTDERTDAFAAVVTGGGVTEADVVLVTDIYDGDILNVISITSDNVLDAPLPDSFVGATNTLTIRGLAAADTRDLVVIYEYDALAGQGDTTGTFLDMLPIFIAIATAVIIVGAIVLVFVNRRSGG